MTTEKSKTNKKWTSTQEYRDNFDRIFGRAIEKGREKTRAGGTEPPPADGVLALPQSASETCPECGTAPMTSGCDWGGRPGRDHK